MVSESSSENSCEIEIDNSSNSSQNTEKEEEDLLELMERINGNQRSKSHRIMEIKSNKNKNKRKSNGTKNQTRSNNKKRNLLVLWSTDSNIFETFNKTYNARKRRKTISSDVEVWNKETLPYLDILMFFDKEKNLEFKVYTKPNSNMKYVNSTS